jgi:hypothetical protein
MTRNAVAAVVAVFVIPVALVIGAAAALGQATTPAAPAATTPAAPAATTPAAPAASAALKAAQDELTALGLVLAKGGLTLSQELDVRSRIERLADVIALLEGGEPQKAPFTTSDDYVRKYAEVESAFGSEAWEDDFASSTSAAYRAAHGEKDPVVKKVKNEVVGDVSDQLTLMELGQEELHVAAYREAIEIKAGSPAAVKVLQRERIRDERTIETLKNPGIAGSLWRWWHRN